MFIGFAHSLGFGAGARMPIDTPQIMLGSGRHRCLVATPGLSAASGDTSVHHVGRLDWSFADQPSPATATSSGLSRAVLVGPAQGAAHTELAAGALAPGGWLGRHIHSFEEALYILEGELIFEIDRRVHRLVAGDFALIPIGTHHTLAATPTAGVRWLSVSTPPRRPAGAPVPDTIFAHGRPNVEALIAVAAPLDAPDPTRRYVGHYLGTPPQAEALAVADPARGRAPAGMDIAILAYSGISVKMLIDRTFGADHLTMFTVDYEVGGAAQAHDHPFEETYVFLAGEVEAELDGQPFTFRPGRRGVRGRRQRPRLLERRPRSRSLDRDAGATAAGAQRLSLAALVGRTRGTGHRALARRRIPHSLAIAEVRTHGQHRSRRRRRRHARDRPGAGPALRLAGPRGRAVRPVAGERRCGRR